MMHISKRPVVSCICPSISIHLRLTCCMIVPWAAQSWLEPSCIFAPGNAKHLSFAVKHIASLGSQFAMRGGGHMPITSSHSINSTGVLISSTNLDTLALSADKKTLSIGSGRRWSDAFEFLEGTGRSVVGARSTHVGVPGMLLGGGISFYSYEYGLGSTNGNVQAYEVLCIRWICLRKD